MHTPPVDAPPSPPDHRLAVRAALVLAVCSVLLITLVAVRWHPLMSLDGDIADTTHRWAVDEPGLTHVFRIFTDWVWDPWTMRLLCAVVVVWLVWRRAAWWTAGWLAVTCALGTAVQQSLKAAVDRPRPVWPDPVDTARYAAYPSGHVLTATVVLGLLLWLLHHYGAGRALRHRPRRLRRLRPRRRPHPRLARRPLDLGRPRRLAAGRADRDAGGTGPRAPTGMT